MSDHAASDHDPLWPALRSARTLPTNHRQAPFHAGDEVWVAHAAAPWQGFHHATIRADGAGSQRNCRTVGVTYEDAGGESVPVVACHRNSSLFQEYAVAVEHEAALRCPEDPVSCAVRCGALPNSSACRATAQRKEYEAAREVTRRCAERLFDVHPWGRRKRHASDPDVSH